jgi:hypothetical protein
MQGMRRMLAKYPDYQKIGLSQIREPEQAP